MIESLVSVFMASCIYFVVIEWIFTKDNAREKAQKMALKSTSIFFILSMTASLYGWLGFLVVLVVLVLAEYVDRRIKRSKVMRLAYVGIMTFVGAILGMLLLAVLLLMGTAWGISVVAAFVWAAITVLVCFLIGWVFVFFDPAHLDGNLG